jgi:hypothetical protein
MKTKQSNSSGTVDIFDRARYLIDLFRMRWRGRGNFDNRAQLRLVDEYMVMASKHGINLAQAKVLEIGVGQRPYLGITLHGLGYDYCGIDLDVPIFPPSAGKAWRLYRANGLLRLLKTLVRYYLFDQPEYAKLLSSLGLKPRDLVGSSIFIQANAACVDLNSLLAEPASVEVADHASRPLVVISESVFEHIPRIDLVSILNNLKAFALASRRPLLLLTRPTIYTGICGSHLTEWYHHAVYSTKHKRSQPWEHLRLNRFTADTYLNRLSLADYRKLFIECGYAITRESVKHPGLGDVFLQDPLTRSELAAWSDEELLSNDIMFEIVPVP